MIDLLIAADSLETGHPFAAVLHESDALRSDAVRDAIASAGPGARIIRVGNAQAGPLTIEGLVFQISGGRTDGSVAGSPSIRELCAPGANQRRTVLVIEQAETLDGPALRALQAAGLESRNFEQPLQVLFSGNPAFLSRLSDPELALIRYTVTTDSPELDGLPTVQASVPNDLPAGWLTPGPMPERQRGPCRLLSMDEEAPPERNKYAMQAALVMTTAMLSAIVTWRDQGPGDVQPPPAYTAMAAESPATASLAFVLPLTTNVPEPAPEPAAAGQGVAAAPRIQVSLASPPPEAEPSRMRREFDAFVLGSGQVSSRLTDAQRQTLFDEFQAWRARGSPRRSVAATGGPAAGH